MATQTCSRLIDELCAQVPLGDPRRLYQDAALQVGGISIRLQAVDTERFHCSVDFGEPPQEHRAEVLQGLLEINTLLGGPHSPKFGINPVTGCVHLSGFLPLQETTGESLAALLRRYEAQAQEWQRTHYLAADVRRSAGRGRAAAPQRVNNPFATR